MDDGDGDVECGTGSHTNLGVTQIMVALAVIALGIIAGDYMPRYIP
jgi:hypothetical protein